MKNSKAVLGKTIALFIATIVIVIILLIFVIGSSVVREIDKSDAGIKVYNSSQIGLENLDEYMKDYLDLVGKRFQVSKDNQLKDFSVEVDYEQ